MKIPFKENPRLVRGLDYYTKTAFEYTSSSLGGQDAVAAGGRYDDLIEQLGGPPTPAFGFAVGMERLLLVLNKKVPPEKPKVFLAHMGDEARDEGLLLLRELRKKGISAEMVHDSTKSIKSQMKLANKSGAKFALILGEDERKANKITLKNMSDSSQETVSQQEIIALLVDKLRI